MFDRHVIVVGGGLAGLTATVELARQDLAVTLFEAAVSLVGALGPPSATARSATWARTRCTRVDRAPRSSRISASSCLVGDRRRTGPDYCSTGGSSRLSTAASAT